MAKKQRVTAQKNKAANRFVDTRARLSIDEQLRQVGAGLSGGVFVYAGPLSVNEFAAKLNKRPADIIKYFFLKKQMIGPNHTLSVDQIGEICLDFGIDFRVEREVTKENLLEQIQFDDKREDTKPRPPIVTIMGHVDHGKTTLLDTIRQANVAAGESGGITQHIGAYQAAARNQLITFIDTPGHAAFTQMRARGADVTDLVILVVAQDDGVMPQTEEAISHATNAKTPIIVFVNKMDKAHANADRVKEQLSRRGLMPEDWGGDTIYVEGSARTKQGIDKLLDSILALAEIHDYRARYDVQPFGVVIEASQSRTQGPIATVIVLRGTLRLNDYITLGAAHGRIRTMTDEHGAAVREATPAKPVKITGFSAVPEAGERFAAFAREQEAREVAEAYWLKRQQQRREQQSATVQLREKIATGELKTLNVIVRADTQGTLQALVASLSKLDVAGARVSVVHSATGAISENDVQLAQASQAVILGFNVALPKHVKEAVQNAQIVCQLHDVIYRMLDDITALLKGKLDPTYEDHELGEAQVLATWKHSVVGTIAGCLVKHGKIKRGASCRVVRDGAIVYKSKIASLKRVKEDASEVNEGLECGLVVDHYNDVKIGDVIQVFETITKEQA